MHNTKKEVFALQKPGHSSEMAYFQRYWLERTEFENGITRSDLAAALAVGSNYISMLKAAKNKSYLTMSQIRIFARFCHMSDVDVLDMYAALFKQKDGKQMDFDLPTFQWLIGEVESLLRQEKIDRSHPLLTVVEPT